MSNSRVRTTALGATVERVATETHIFYDPATQDAQIVFQGEEYLTSVDGLQVGDKLEGREALTIQLSSIATKIYNAGVDPVTGADLSQFSPAGVAAIIRAVYDVEHNARAEQQAQAAAELAAADAAFAAAMAGG